MEIFPGRTFVIEYEVFAEDPQLTVAGTARLSSHHVCEGLEPQQVSHRLALTSARQTSSEEPTTTIQDSTFRMHNL